MRLYGLGLVLVASLAIPVDASAITIFYNTPSPTLESWDTFTIPLSETGWRVDSYTSGPAPTSAEFQHVLANLQGLYILTEWRTGPDDTNVDNVAFGSGAADDFGAGNGGWTVAGPDPSAGDIYDQAVPTSPLPWAPNFGNPAGSVQAGDVYFWTWIGAPAGYLGDQSARYGEDLTFDIFIRFTDAVEYPMVALVAPDAPVTEVPEPASLLLFGSGLAGLYAKRKRS